MTVFSRDQIESRLIKRVEDFERGYRQNVAVLGRSGVGKTKLVSKVFDHVRSRATLLPITISIGEVATPHLISYWIRCLLASALSLADNSIESLLETSETNLPKTCKAARHILKLNKQGNTALAVRELFALGGQLAEETGRKVVFFLDELLALEKFSINDVYSIFGNRLMMEKEALFIVTSSDPRRARKIFSEKLSLLFSNFESLDIQPLGFREMNLAVDGRACATYLSLPARRFLFRMTDGEPRYLESLLRHLDESVCSDPRRQIGVAMLFETVIREVLEADGRIAMDFQKRVASFRRSLRERDSLIVEACAALGMGKVRSATLATVLGLKLPETKKLMARMEEEDWLISGGSSYSLRDSLFRFWAAEYLAPSCAGHLLDEKSRRARWTRRLSEIYEDCFESDMGKVALRLESLLKLFRSETLNLDGRKVSAVHFNEVDASSLSEYQSIIRAHSSKEKRFFLTAVEELKEQDVEHFWLSSGGRKKPAKRILVAVAGIEQNAKLFAQQNRMEIWDLRFFNQLLDFFGLPKVIIEKRGSAWESDSSWIGTQSLFSTVTT